MEAEAEMMNFGYEGISGNQGMMVASTGQYGQYFPLEALNWPWGIEKTWLQLCVFP